MQCRLADAAQITDLEQNLNVDSNPRHFREATLAMSDSMLPLPGLSPVGVKTVVAKFDGGLLL